VEGRPLDDEKQLIDRARAGDVNAYEQLVERYANVALRTAYVIVGSQADAEDATQEAFFKAYRALRGFRPGSGFRPWLLQIVANEARNQRRGSGRRQNLAVRVVEGLRTGGAAPSPEAEAENAEERDQLLRAVNTLRDEDRQVVACRYFLDLSTDETAHVLRCPPGTVKSRLSRALDRLRANLGENRG
jgi:RNA polymerase sigma factor (sigma-70 family)